MLHAAQDLLGRSGAADWYSRTCSVGGAVILMYHSVARTPEARWIDPRDHIPPAVFEAHVRFLARRRRVISLAELIADLETGRNIGRGTVVITFDDGYRDNLEVAFPILNRYGLPATLFLPTGYIDRAECQWIDRLFSSFRTRTMQRLNIPAESGVRMFDLSRGRGRKQAYAQASAHLLSATRSDREALLDAIDEQLRPKSGMPTLTMSWNDVREALERFSTLEVGSHSVSHIDVTAHEDELVYRELESSKERIEGELDRRVRYFSFPYNRVSESAMQMLKPLGYEAAVADGADVLIRNTAKLFALPRIEAPTPLSRLALVTSGAYPDLSIRLFGRA